MGSLWVSREDPGVGRSSAVVVAAGWLCGIGWRLLGDVLFVLSMVDRVEVWSGLWVVGTADGKRPGAGATSLCLCFHLACPLSDRSNN